MVKPIGFLDFEIVGSRAQVEHMLMRLDTALSPWGIMAFMNSFVSPWLQERAESRFANEGDDAVGSWAPLKESTQEIRESHGFGASHPINRRTGELEAYIMGDSLVQPIAGGVTLKMPGKPSGKASVREKMRTAQKGRTNPPTVPRPVLGMNETDLSHILTGLAFHVKNFP